MLRRKEELIFVLSLWDASVTIWEVMYKEGITTWGCLCRVPVPSVTINSASRNLEIKMGKGYRAALSNRLLCPGSACPGRQQPGTPVNEVLARNPCLGAEERHLFWRNACKTASQKAVHDDYIIFISVLFMTHIFPKYRKEKEKKKGLTISCI